MFVRSSLSSGDSILFLLSTGVLVPVLLFSQTDASAVHQESVVPALESNGADSKIRDSKSELADVSDRWSDSRSFWEENLFPSKVLVIRVCTEAVTHVQRLSPTCKSALTTFAADLSASRLNAVKMLDASASLSGMRMFHEEFSHLGDYDQCIRLPNGRFSLLHVHWPLPTRGPEYSLPKRLELNSTPANGTWLQAIADYYKYFYFKPMVLGMCSPAACGTEDMEQVAEYFSEKMKSESGRGFKLEIGDSVTKEDTGSLSMMPYVKIPALLVLVSFVLMTALATAICYLWPASNYTLLIQAFDVKRNLESVTSLPQSELGKRLAFMSGIRVQYLLFAIVGHMYFPTSQEMVPVALGLLSFARSSILASVAGNSLTPVLAVNFVLGGCLSFLTWHRHVVTQGRRLKFLPFVILRFLRSVPVMTATILLPIAYLPSMGSGPLFHANLRNLTISCFMSGWKDVMLIGNQRTEVSDVCFAPNWYVAADFQLYVPSFVLLGLMMNKGTRRLAVGLCVILIGVGIGLQYLALTLVKYPPFILLRDYDVQTNSEFVEWHTWAAFNYLPSYVMGLLLGMGITSGVRIPNHWRPVLWLILPNLLFTSIGIVGLLLSLPIEVPTMVSDLIGVQDWMLVPSSITGSEYEDNSFRLPESLVLGIGSTMRAWLSALFAAMCFLAYNETETDKGPENLFMRMIRSMIAFNGNPWFVYFGKISFPAFLIHYVAIVHMWALSDALPVMSFIDLMMRTCYIFIVSIVGGLAMHLVFEAPILVLAKGSIGGEKRVENPVPGRETRDKKAD